MNCSVISPKAVFLSYFQAFTHFHVRPASQTLPVPSPAVLTHKPFLHSPHRLRSAQRFFPADANGLPLQTALFPTEFPSAKTFAHYRGQTPKPPPHPVFEVLRRKICLYLQIRFVICSSGHAFAGLRKREEGREEI